MIVDYPLTVVHWREGIRISRKLLEGGYTGAIPAICWKTPDHRAWVFWPKKSKPFLTATIYDSKGTPIAVRVRTQP